MSDKNISSMNFKELRNEVRSLRDELAVMKRKYEDMFYNLDDENFCGRIIKERDSMKAEISVTAEEIKTKVSETDLASALVNYSTVSQTADAISSVVSSGANLKDAIEITDISQADDISEIYKIPEYNADKKVIGESYYYYNSLSGQWEKISGDTVYTMFTQTAEGFVLKGNTVIDGNATITRNLTLSGNVTWDMENSPVKTQYSSDGMMWHEFQTDGDMYMRMSFDGGSVWSNPTKVVGTDGQDGQNGHDGSDAEVTPENVFNALTDDGAAQGIFAAFVNNGNRLYINAEYLATKIANVADYLYIGDAGDNAVKRITFSSGAAISTFLDGTGNPPTGINISASTFRVNDGDISLGNSGYTIDFNNAKIKNLNTDGLTATVVFG